MTQKCYACDRPFRQNSWGRFPFHPTVLTIDGQRQTVGYDCWRRVLGAGINGYQPPRGGPRIYAEVNAPESVLRAAGIVLIRQ